MVVTAPTCLSGLCVFPAECGQLPICCSSTAVYHPGFFTTPCGNLYSDLQFFDTAQVSLCFPANGTPGFALFRASIDPFVFVGPAAAPEVDPHAAPLAVAVLLVGLCLHADRRRRA
ncbi:MAG TPA: hypothetical protein VGO93_14160 [Candidatus Xenobia bacterium]